MEIPLYDVGVRFYCRNCGREGHRRYYCPELKDGLTDRRFRCRICGEKGHNRRTCPKSRLMSSRKNTVRRHHLCKICHKRGHNRRTCPKITGVKLISSGVRRRILSSGRRTYKCRFCQETGHNVRTCPRRSASALEINPHEGNQWTFLCIIHKFKEKNKAINFIFTSLLQNLLLRAELIKTIKIHEEKKNKEKNREKERVQLVNNLTWKLNI